jgi:hypothetical protein
MGGIADGTFTPKEDHGPPPHKLEKWNGDSDVPSGRGEYHNPHPTEPPPVPKGTESSHDTSVDTPSMQVFAGNIEQLISPVQKCQQVLRDVDVSPGAFFHAYKVRSKVSGSGGLKENYGKILDDLADGLTNLCSGVRNLSKEYDSVEEANGMTAKELEEYMYNTKADFVTLGQDTSKLG